MKLFIDNSRRKQPDLAKLLLLDDEPYDPVSLDDAETPSESSVDSQNPHPTASLASSSQLSTSSSIPASATTKPPATHPSASPAGDTCPTTEEEVDEVEQQKHDDSPVQSLFFPKEKPLSTARNLPSWMRDAPSPAPRPAKRAAPASQRKPAASPKPTSSSSAPKRLKTAISPRGRAAPRSRRPTPAKRVGAQPSTSSESEIEESEEEELVEENDEKTTHHLPPPAASPSLPPSKRLSKVIDDDEEPEGDNDAAPETRSASVCEGLPSDFANLDKRTVVELRQLCRNFNIRAVRSNKTQLVELLAAFLKSQMRATPSPPPSKVAQPIVSPSSISSLSHTSLSHTSLSHPSLSHTSLSPLSLGANSPLPSGTGASESSRQLFHSSSSDEAIPTVVRKRTKVKPEHRPQQQQTSSAVLSTMPHVSTAVQQSNKASSFNPDATLIEEVDVPDVLSGTLIVSDDGSTLRVSGETNTLRLSGDANSTLRLSGDENTLRLSGTLVVSDDSHTLVVSDDAGTLAVPSTVPLPHGSATIPVPYGSATIPVPYASSLAPDSVDSTLLLESTLLDSSLTLAHECQSADPTLRISGELPIDQHESKLPSFDVNNNNNINQLAPPLIQRKKELYSSFLSPPFHVEQPSFIVISLSDGLIFPLFERKCIQICRKYSSSKSPISRCHFELFLLQGKPMCHDRSKNGTFVNHTRIPSHQIHPLNDGDLISISQTDSFLLKYLIS